MTKELFDEMYELRKKADLEFAYTELEKRNKEYAVLQNKLKNLEEGEGFIVKTVNRLFFNEGVTEYSTITKDEHVNNINGLLKDLIQKLDKKNDLIDSFNNLPWYKKIKGVKA